MSGRTDPVDLVFDLATELALIVDATNQALNLTIAHSQSERMAVGELLAQRMRESREGLKRFKAWCDEGPES